MNALTRLLSAVRRRERLADAAYGLTRFGLPTGLFTAAMAIFAIRIIGFGPQILWLTAAPLPIIIGWAFLRPRSIRATARKVDEHYDLDDELGAALELQKTGPRGTKGDDARTRDIVELLKSQAEARAAGLSPKGVVEVRVPPPGVADAIALALIAVAAILPVPRSSRLETWLNFPAHELAEIAEANEGLDLALADPLRQNLRGLSDAEDEVAKVAERILKVLDALEKGELDRAEAFEMLEELEESLAEAEKKLEEDMEEDPGILADAVRELADALQDHEVTEEAGEHFDESRPEEGEESLNEAGKKAEEGDKDAQEAMRQAMAEAEKRLAKEAKQNSDTAKQLDEAERRLRKEQKRESKDPEEKERRLKDLKKRVEQLKRKQEREQAAKRKLEQLRRNASDAANKRNKASQRRRSLEKLSRGARQAAQQARKAGRTRQLRDSLEEAKTFVRRAGKQGDGAKKRRQQFKKFSKAAKGKQGKDGKNKGKGKNTMLVEGQVGDGQPDMIMEGQGDSQGQGEGEGEGEGESDSDGQGDGQGQDGGQGQQPGGDGIGDGSVDPLADPRSMNVNKKNLRVKAKRGKGVSRAEVIKDSSQRGFATESYRRVFTDYRGHAQSALDNEALPPAKRRAVKRYYQYIQPRD